MVVDEFFYNQKNLPAVAPRGVAVGCFLWDSREKNLIFLCMAVILMQNDFM